MTRPQLPVWLWILGGYVLLRAFGVELNLLSLLLVGYVAWVVLGGRARSRRRVDPYRPSDRADAAQPRSAPPDQDGPMPTIDVPRFPGAAAQPADPWGGGAPPPPPPAPRTEAGGSSPASDPAVSLVRLQVAQAGRDLEQARAGGDPRRVEAALTRLDTVVEHARAGLTTGSAEASRLRATLDGLRGGVQEALRAGDGPQRGVLFDRIASACRTMGQTGGHA